METVRDLGRSEPWQESLERSRARRSTEMRSRDTRSRDTRSRETRSFSEATDRRPQRSRRAASPSPPGSRHRSFRTRSIATRWRLVVGAGGALAVLLLADALPSTFGGRRAQAAANAAQVDSVGAPAGQSYASSGGAALGSRDFASSAPVARRARNCQAADPSSGYVNPLAGAVVTGERVDQGVDYAGSGTLAALGAGKVTYVGTSGTGWPGAFIEYRLSDGPDRGCFVYYAEGVNPVAGLRVGATVRAGQSIATIIPGWPSGVELGWGAGTSTKTYAAKMRQWSAKKDSDSIASAAGRSFSSMVATLGGPAGRVEG